MSLFAEATQEFEEINEDIPENIFDDIELETNPDAPGEEIFKKPVPQRKVKQERKPRANGRTTNQKSTSRTSTRKTTQKTIDSYSGVNFQEIFDKTELPSIQDFSKSTVIQTFAWFIKNIPKDNPGQIMINTKEKSRQDIPKITIKDFPKFIKEIYPRFCYIYKLNKFLKEIKTNYPALTITLKGRKIKSGNKQIFELDQKEFDENLKEYKRQLLYLHKNIDFTAIKDEKMFQYLRLNINTTSNAYEWGNGDFDRFGFMYEDDEDYRLESMTNEEKTKQYHELFTKNIIGKPAEIFKRRETFLDTIEESLLEEYRELTLKQIEEFDNSNIPTKAQEEVDKYLETFAYMLKTETFRNIIFKCYKPNNILEKILVKFFNSKSFLHILDNGVNQISYLFTPRSFWSKPFNALAKPHEKKTLINRRKSLIEVLMAMDEASLLKNNSWWTSFVNNSEDDLPENPWEETTKDKAKKEKKQTTTQKKTQKPTENTEQKTKAKESKQKPQPKLEDEDEEENEKQNDEEEEEQDNDEDTEFEEFEI